MLGGSFLNEGFYIHILQEMVMYIVNFEILLMQNVTQYDNNCLIGNTYRLSYYDPLAKYFV